VYDSFRIANCALSGAWYNSAVSQAAPRAFYHFMQFYSIEQKLYAKGDTLLKPKNDIKNDS